MTKTRPTTEWTPNRARPTGRASPIRLGFRFSKHVAAAALLAPILATGCSGIDHAILDNMSPMPDSSMLSSGSGQLHTGIAAAFKPRVWTHDLWGTHEQGSSDIGVQTSDGSILHVAPVTNDSRFVVWAVAPGKATLTVTLSGDVAMRVPITVTDPPQ